jgi:hypothetical protein
MDDDCGHVKKHAGNFVGVLSGLLTPGKDCVEDNPRIW